MEQYKPLLILSALLHYITLLKLSAGFLDTLFPNQTVAVGHTLISPNHVFEIGFFSPGSSTNKFLGIWYRHTPDVVVWVANRDHPITHSDHLCLAIASNGNLVIRGGRDGRAVVWTTNISGTPFNPMLQLLNTGNLALVDQTSESSLPSYVWQSFDYPTDTLLPGMKLVDDVDGAGVERFLRSWKDFNDPSFGDFVLKIENRGLASVVLFKGSKKVYRTGTWNGLYFSGTKPFPTQHFSPEMVFEKQRLVSLSTPFHNSTFTRLTIDASGVLKYLILNSRKSKWHVFGVIPEEPCGQYGVCGPFGICRNGVAIKCSCLKGYTPKFQDDWDLQDWSGGCTRTTPLDCTNQDHGFLEITGVKYPDMLQFSMNNSLSLTECRASCLRHCSCKAYANPYINGSTGCVMWFGELIDTSYLPRSDTKQKLYIRVLNSELGEIKNWPIMLVIVAFLSGVFILLFINGGVHYLTRRTRQERIIEDLELPLYKLSTITTATNNFSEENLIGKGGFGSVYRGNLSLKREIAVKRLSTTSGQGIVEFETETRLISKLQHRNLVKLLGCCIEQGEKILIYEYMPNKSLDTFVFDQTRKTILTWTKRFNIIMGIAKGLLYLHHDSRLKIIHRDLKTSNILLDENLNSKISDFGLARPFEEDQSTAKTKRIVGTHGYMSPEYAFAGKFSMKSDIFSFGVVLLEIVSGKRNRGFVHFDEYNNLLEYVWLLWEENRMLEIMDECLINTFIESQVKRCVHVGLLCVQKYAEDRPDMISICSMLTTNEPILWNPTRSGFFVERDFKTVRSCTFTCAKSRNGTISITDLEAR